MSRARLQKPQKPKKDRVAQRARKQDREAEEPRLAGAGNRALQRLLGSAAGRAPLQLHSNHEERVTEAPSERFVVQGARLPPPVGGKKVRIPWRQMMEKSFQTSFDSVRVHRDSKAAEEMGAKAFSQGEDIFFARGHYRPHTQSGRELLGHEMAHVVQQRSGRVETPKPIGGVPVNADRNLEMEAHRAGIKAVRRLPAPIRFNKPGPRSLRARPVQRD